MRPQRRSWLAPILLGSGLLTAGVGGTLGTLVATGVVPNPFFVKEEKTFQPPEGTVPVLLSVKAIPAYTKVTRDHLFEVTGKPKLFHLTPAEIETRGIYTDFNKILGRVTSHDVKPGYAFREKDFLPEGARDGVAGGTPAGKRAMVLDAAKLQGVHALRANDHVDLIATYPVDVAKPNNKNVIGEAENAPKKQALVKVLVQDGVVILPVTTRQVPQPKSTSAKPVMMTLQEVVLAVEPTEIAAIGEALGAGAEVMAVFRSGQPGEPVKALPTPGSQPKAPPVRIEVLQGETRQVFTFAKGIRKRETEESGVEP